MKKEKGFTLIELLAVIVILSILMVVAVPKILNVINKSKESAADSSIKLVKDAIKTQVSSGDIIGTSFTKDNDNCYTFDFDDQENGNAKELQLKNKEKITGSIKYCNGEFSDDTLNFDGNRVIPPKICKRASTLHTEVCNMSSAYCSGSGYSNGQTITYGNLGEKRILKSGDAFDCDVNGDGIYDSETERFYYVSDYYDPNTETFDNNYATLIYYNNVSKGVADTSSKILVSYDTSGKNNNGPVTAITNLPTSEQWSNITLKNPIRKILTENNLSKTSAGTLPNTFSYEGYSARLLTTQEINNACNITVGNSVMGELNNCNYLLENTKYSSSSIATFGYWLENPKGDVSANAWYVYAGHRRVDNDSQGGINCKVLSSNLSTRPVIEVQKTSIDY